MRGRKYEKSLLVALDAFFHLSSFPFSARCPLQSLALRVAVCWKAVLPSVLPRTWDTQKGTSMPRAHGPGQAPSRPLTKARRRYLRQVLPRDNDAVRRALQDLPHAVVEPGGRSVQRPVDLTPVQPRPATREASERRRQRALAGSPVQHGPALRGERCRLQPVFEVTEYFRGKARRKGENPSL